MKLHLGCGHRYIPGFVHVDLYDLLHVDYKSGIDDLSVLDDGAASLIYSSHSFEYFDRTEAVGVLKEWYRVLAPGGVLRLAVPDFDALIRVYRESGSLDRILGPLYGRMEIESQNGNEMLYHKTTYNFDSLKELLEENGFKKTHRYNWRNTIHKDYDDHSQAYFPHMDKDGGLLISLNVEAVK